MFKSRRFTWYVMKELATPTLLGLLLYSFVLLMNHFFLVAEKALSKNLGAELTFQLFAVGIPKILVLSIPMSVLLGTLITLGRLSADHEWVALQSAGHGPSVLLRPVLLHGLLGTLISFGIYAVVVPRTHYLMSSLRGQVLFSSNLAADLSPREFYELPDNSVLFVDDIRAGGHRRLENVLLIRSFEKRGSTQLVLARYGDLFPAPDGSGAILVDFFGGEAHIYQSEAPETYQFFTFDGVERERLPPPDFLQVLLRPPNKVAQDLSLPELLEEVRESSAERRSLRAELGDQEAGRGRLMVVDRRAAVARVELHQRIALPLASLLFALLALPLGIAGVRSGKGAGFAMSVVVILVYRIVFVLARNQAVAGNIPADLGPWVANGVILIWAIIALRRLRYRSVRSGGTILTAPLHLWEYFRKKFSKRPRTDRQGSERESDRPWEDSGLGGTPHRFVRRLDRYVGLAYLRILMFALVSAYLIYGLIEFQDLMDGILKTRQPLWLILKYFQYFAPSVLHIALPIACLIGSIVAFTLLSRTSELVAIKAAGVSMRRTTAPVVFMTILMCGLLFVVQDRIAPSASRRAQALKDQITKRAPRTHGRPTRGSWVFGPDGRNLYHYSYYAPGEKEFVGLSVFGLDRSVPRVTDHRYCAKARFTGESWELEDGWYRTFEPTPDLTGGVPGVEIQSPVEIHEGTVVVDLNITPDTLVEYKRRLAAAGGGLPDQMTIAELKERIRTLSNSGYDITELRVAYYGKFARATSPLIMVLLGLPFAFKVGRRGSLYGIGVGLLLVLVYWATFAVFNALGLETMLSPPVAAWAPNALYGLLGVYLLLYIKT